MVCADLLALTAVLHLMALSVILEVFSMREKFDASFVFIRAESREERKSKNKFLLMGSHIRRYLGKSLFIRNGTTHFTMVTKSVI